MAVEISHKKLPTTQARPSGSGSQLGSGYVTGRLGEGGMATVYEIWNPQLSVSRAVKLLRRDHTPESRERFSTEVKLTAQLDHPNIIRIHSVGEWQGRPYIEMEKVHGWSLDVLLTERGPLPKKVAVAVALLIARALTYTHSLKYRFDGAEVNGLLHRDLKPANILLSRKGWVRLTDFGIATPVDVSMHTPDGSIVGSLHYIAPEQLRGDSVDARADMFSFGCVLYEMFAGNRAFPDSRLARLIPQRLANTYSPLREGRGGIPRSLTGLVRRCMAADPGKRPSEFRSIRKTLESIYEKWTDSAPEETIEKFLNAKDIPDSTGAPIRVLQIPARPAVAAAILSFLILVLCVPPIRNQGWRAVRIMKTGIPGLSAESQVSVEKESPPIKMSLEPILARYGTPDQLTAMEYADGEGNHEIVLFLSEYLSGKKRKSQLGILLVTRALEELGFLTDEHFHSFYINEAEYAFMKAQHHFGNGHYISALSATESFEKYDALLIDKEELWPKVLELRVACRGALERKGRDVVRAENSEKEHSTTNKSYKLPAHLNADSAVVWGPSAGL